MNKIIIYTAAVALLFLAACSGRQEKKEAATTEKVKYNTMVVSLSKIGKTVQLPGVLMPFQFVQMFPKVNGFVKSVPVDRGSIVRKGQLLLTLEAPEIEQGVAAAELRYTQAKAVSVTSKDKYNRMFATSKTPGTVSAYDLEAAGAQLSADSATTQAEYANYLAQLTMKNYLTVSAPFDGVITERNVHPGALCGPGEPNEKPMLVLQQLSKLRLTVEIPEQYAEQISDGDTVKYTVNALPGQYFTGTVSRSSNNLSNNYRAETIEIDVQNVGNIFKPGMYAEVQLPATGNSHCFVVPLTAVVTTTESKYVVVNIGNHAHLVDVTQGNQTNDSTEIFGNLHLGDEIVTNATYLLKEGVEIR